MIKKTTKLKTYSYDIWVWHGSSAPYPAGTRTIEFESFPTNDDILDNLLEHFSDLCPTGRRQEKAKFYNINMYCIKFYVGSDTSATYYLVNNIREIRD